MRALSCNRQHIHGVVRKVLRKVAFRFIMRMGMILKHMRWVLLLKQGTHTKMQSFQTQMDQWRVRVCVLLSKISFNRIDGQDALIVSWQAFDVLLHWSISSEPIRVTTGDCFNSYFLWIKCTINQIGQLSFTYSIFICKIKKIFTKKDVVMQITWEQTWK